MNSLFFVAALSAVLFTLPAMAQLGPAGVPGAPGLAETDPSIKAVRAATPPPQMIEKPVPQKKVVQKTTRTTCQGKVGNAKQRCTEVKPRQSKKADCRKSPDPARCEQHSKARELCKDKLGGKHRQCLLDALVQSK